MGSDGIQKGPSRASRFRNFAARMTAHPTKPRGPLLWLAGRSQWFWIGVALLPILYVVSFGPACWISSRVQPSGEIISVLYQPAIHMYDLPEPVFRVFLRFVLFGLPSGCGISVDDHAICFGPETHLGE
jgi:hypothetical protein